MIPTIDCVHTLFFCLHACMHQFLDLLLFAVDIVAIDASMMPTILPQAPDINETYIHNFTEISEYTHIYIYILARTYIEGMLCSPNFNTRCNCSCIMKYAPMIIAPCLLVLVLMHMLSYCSISTSQGYCFHNRGCLKIGTPKSPGWSSLVKVAIWRNEPHFWTHPNSILAFVFVYIYN